MLSVDSWSVKVISWLAKHRRDCVAAALTILFISAIAALSMPWWLRPYIEHALQRRLQAEVRLGSIKVRWQRLDLQRLHIAAWRGDLQVSIAELTLRVPFWQLAEARAHSVKTASMHGVRIAARDAHGSLLHARMTSIQLHREVCRMKLRDLTVGEGGWGKVHVENATLKLHRVEGLWRIDSARASSLSLRRAKASWAAWSQRGQNWRGRWRQWTQRRRSAATPLQNETASLLDLDRLAKNAVLHTEHLDVFGVAAPTRNASLHLSGVELRRLTHGLCRSTGSGYGDDAGKVAWDLEFGLHPLKGVGRIEVERLPLTAVAALLPELPWHHAEQGSLDANLSLHIRSPDDLDVAGSVQLRGLMLASPRLASLPLDFAPVGMQLRATWQPSSKRLMVQQAVLRVGAVEFGAAGLLQIQPTARRLELMATLAGVSCQAMLEAVPLALWQPLEEMRLKGQMAASLSMVIDSRDLAATQLDVRTQDRCRFVGLPAIADVQRLRRPFLHQVREATDAVVFEMETGPGSADWAPLAEISPWLIEAILAHEDAGFFKHRGFASWAIREALARNLVAGRYVQGASTISMQLVKNLFLRREKTLARKVQEALLTWWLESVASKQEILQLYLNVIEFGPNVYGIRAASHYYFGCTPAQLNPAQAAFLALILPAPKSAAQQAADIGASKSLRERLRRLLEHMHATSRLDDATLALGLEQVEQFSFSPMPPTDTDEYP